MENHKLILSFKDKIVKIIVITNNFNINIRFLNSRDFSKRVLYIGTEVVIYNQCNKKSRLTSTE